MKKKMRVNLSIDGDIYKKFQEYCKKNGMTISAKVELYMTKELKR